MEEEAPSRCSVAELAGRFRGSAPPPDAAEKQPPVRRRPPRSLQLPKTHGDEQEVRQETTSERQSPAVTSPAKSKRNSALIEKLQASLALPPSTQLPSPKSPGFRLLPLSFPPPSPGSAPLTTGATYSMPTPTTPTPTSPITEEEGPTSFEAPPTVVEGSILSSINKSRARHSIRRRPPSRRHRKSSSGEEVSDAIDATDSGTEGRGGGDQEEEGVDIFKTETKTDDSTCPEKEEEKKEEKDSSSSGGDKEHEVEEAQENHSAGETHKDHKTEEKTEEMMDHTSAR